MATKPAQKTAKVATAAAKAPSKARAKAKTEKAPAKEKPVKPVPVANSKFAEFIKAKKLDPRRLLIASRHLEQLQPEDRAIKLSKRTIRNTEGDDKPKETRKPRSGRPLTHRALNAALFGTALKGPVKTRILRAVNHLLEQKKGEKVELKTLF
jgi:hypothetical protein